MELRPTPLYRAERIRRRVGELARQISLDFAGQHVCLIAVLKGGVVFAADLMRGLTVPVTVDFIGAKSYTGTESNGHLEFTVMPTSSIEGKNVLLVEDILDTGRTVTGIVERLRQDKPASLSVCTLLDKPSRRQMAVSAEYVGFTVADLFVVGYGLDYEEYGRELPDIHVLEP